MNDSGNLEEKIIQLEKENAYLKSLLTSAGN